jgi:hypothetical protein
MSTFTKALSEFNEHDVKAMDEALRKFANYKKDSGLPDYSPGFVAYTPILSFALLKSQAAVEKVTRRLTTLTWVLAVFAAVQVGLMVWLVIH